MKTMAEKRGVDAVTLRGRLIIEVQDSNQELSLEGVLYEARLRRLDKRVDAEVHSWKRKPDVLSVGDCKSRSERSRVPV